MTDVDGGRSANVLIDGSAARRSGVGTYLGALVAAWQRAPWAADDRLDLVAPRSFFADHGLTASANLRLHELPETAAGRVVGTYLTVPRLIEHTGSTTLLSPVPVVPLGARWVPTVVVCHDLRHLMRPEEFSTLVRARRAVEYPRALKRAKAIVAVSERTAHDLHEAFPQFSDRVCVIKSGADHVPEQASVPPSDGGFRVLAHAQHTNKRPDLALRACAVALASGLPVTLTITGASKRAQVRLTALAQMLGFPMDHLTLEPALPTASYRELASRCSALLLTTTFEGFGLPALEGMRMGMRVVAVPEPALAEIGGDHLITARSDRPEDIADALRHAAADGSVQTRTDAAAWAARFTWEKTAARLRSVLVGLG